jgi:hypothetical protein
VIAPHHIITLHCHATYCQTFDGTHHKDQLTSYIGTLLYRAQRECVKDSLAQTRVHDSHYYGGTGHGHNFHRLHPIRI